MPPRRAADARKALSVQPPAQSTSDETPRTPSGSKRKRVNPPQELDPLGLLSQQEDVDEHGKRQKTVPGGFPSEFDLSQTIEAGPSSSQSGYVDGMAYERPDAGSTSLEAKLPSLSIEAQIEAMRDKYDPSNENAQTLEVDIGGPNQAEELARFYSEQHDKFGQMQSVREALEDLGLERVDDMIPGLDVCLLPHQLIGVAWMLAKERNKRERGGILADDMGLGKTVQALALLVMNPPDLDAPEQRDERRKQTLIIAPAALLDQWRDEIETKASMFSAHIHHGPKKAKDAKVLRKYDIIITSFQTMLLDVEPRSKKETRGPLHSTKWYRIIIDEAQIIRNRVGQISIAAAKLDSTYRWCLSGTPFINGLQDLYPLLRFTRLRPWNDWESFNEQIARQVKQDPNVAAARMQVVVRKHLLRRTKESKLDGKPILELKPKHIEVEYVEFSADERQIFEAVQKRQQQTINKFMKRRTLLKNYQLVLLMILRMRQVCCHPQLIAYAAHEIADPNAEQVLGIAGDGDEDGEGDAGNNDLNKAEKLMGAATINRLRASAKERALASLTKRLNADEEETADGASDNECSLCYDFFTNPRITVCGHQFCKDCIEGVINRPREYQNDEGPGTGACPMCRQPVKITELFNAALFQPTAMELEVLKDKVEKEKQRKKKAAKLAFDLTLDDMEEDDLPDADWWLAKPKDKKGKKKAKKDKKDQKGKGKARYESEDEGEDIIDLTGDAPVVIKSPGKPLRSKSKGKSTRVDSSDDDSMNDSDSDVDSDDSDAPNPFKADMLNKIRDFENSAKMNCMINLLRQWKDETPEDKVVIYSQWTSCMTLLEGALERESMRCVRYDGAMTREERSSAVKRFKKADGPDILLVSLKCGGVGLNLVEANRVINFDPAWNLPAESQAYDRVHRIGQQKEVFVKRLIVRDSIEDRMLKIQQGKDELTKTAMGEGSGRLLQKLNTKDILGLFGMKENNNSN